MPDQEDKTEEPTPKKLEDARNKGTVPKSTELNSVAILIMGLGTLYFWGPTLMDQLQEMTISVLQSPMVEINPKNVQAYYIVGLKFLAMSIGPIMLVLLITGLAVNYAQVGVLFTMEPLGPNFGKLNPLPGFKNFVSMKSMMELFKSIVKLFIIGGISYLTISGAYDEFLVMADSSIGPILNMIFETAFKLGMYIALALLLLAIIDWAFQKFDHNKKQRMTKQEIKDERKQSDGDPLIKARIRQIQQQMAKKRMMDDVPKATVIITNPTHIAIALLYEQDEMKSPKVLAKGKDKTAEAIKKIAKENDIPMVEDKALARAMVDVIEVGEEIPFEFFTAVAEILAYVYSLKNKDKQYETA
jgi:flagellar biosynthesis protein FlhB